MFPRPHRPNSPPRSSNLPSNRHRPPSNSLPIVSHVLMPIHQDARRRSALSLISEAASSQLPSSWTAAQELYHRPPTLPSWIKQVFLLTGSSTSRSTWCVALAVLCRPLTRSSTCKNSSTADRFVNHQEHLTRPSSTSPTGCSFIYRILPVLRWQSLVSVRSLLKLRHIPGTNASCYTPC
jgi:hypothetical protein